MVAPLVPVAAPPANEKVTVCPVAGVESEFLTVAITILCCPAYTVRGVGVKDIVRLLPVPPPLLRVMITAPAEPVTVAETTSWMLKLGELFPAVYMAVAVPLASVVPFTTVKAGAPLLFVTNAKVTASPGAAVPTALLTWATMTLIAPATRLSGVAVRFILYPVVGVAVLAVPVLVIKTAPVDPVTLAWIISWTFMVGLFAPAV